jgi:hypothetical protein
MNEIEEFQLEDDLNKKKHAIHLENEYLIKELENLRKNKSACEIELYNKELEQE